MIYKDVKHLTLFEFYRATDYEGASQNLSVPNFQEDTISLGESFLDSLKKDYVTREGKPYNPEIGNCAWYAQEFYRWCELYRIPVQLIYFNPKDKKEYGHIAIFLNGWVLDLGIKKLTKKKDQEFLVSKIDFYKKFGFDPNEAEILDEFPNWIKKIKPLKERKWSKNTY
jgi:hypothetical protein